MSRRIGIKERAKEERRARLLKDGHYFYEECLSCSLSCEKLCNDSRTYYTLKTCPKARRSTYGKKSRA